MSDCTYCLNARGFDDGERVPCPFCRPRTIRETPKEASRRMERGIRAAVRLAEKFKKEKEV